MMTETEKSQSHGVMQLNREEWMKAYLLEHCASFSSVEDLQKLYEWWNDQRVEKKSEKPKLRPVT